jgi:hypothetical protein
MRVSAAMMALMVGAGVSSADADDANFATQAAAMQAFKSALESGDIKQVSQHAAGETGAILRRVSEPLLKAKAASDRLDKALAAKPEIGWHNPFAAGLAPLAGSQLEVVEIAREGNLFVARVRYRQSPQEETIAIRNEEGAWRVDLPSELAKDLQPLRDPERLDKRRKQLEQLTEVLAALAADIESGKRKTKDEVTLRLLELIADSNLFPSAPQPKAGDKANASG